MEYETKKTDFIDELPKINYMPTNTITGPGCSA